MRNESMLDCVYIVNPFLTYSSLFSSPAGGVDIPHERGCDAHSDGDVLMHCIVDALLGALGLPDIGQLFPDNDPQWKGAASEVFMREAVRRVTDAGRDEREREKEVTRSPMYVLLTQSLSFSFLPVDLFWNGMQTGHGTTDFSFLYIYNSR